MQMKKEGNHENIKLKVPKIYRKKKFQKSTYSVFVKEI